MLRMFLFIVGLLLYIVCAKGQTWAPYTMPGNCSVASIDFYDSEQAILGADSGKVYITSNGGQRWQQVDFGTTSNIIKVDMLSPEKMVVLTSDNEVIVRMNGSERRSFPVPLATLYDVVYLSQNSLVAVGQIGRAGRGVVIRSTDGGRSWLEIGHPGGSSALLYTCLTFLTQREGYMAGAWMGLGGRHTPIVAKTTDGGESWTWLYGAAQSAESFLPQSIQLFGTRTVVVHGNSAARAQGHSLRSTDAGAHWQSIELPMLWRGAHSCTVANNSGFLVTKWPRNTSGPQIVDHAMIMRTTDAGETWMAEYHDTSASAELYCVVSGRGNYVFAGGNNSRILRRSLLCDMPELAQQMPPAISRPRGAHVNINATATTSNAIYRWKKDGKDLEWTEPVLTIPRVRATDEGEYETTITNPCGSIVARCTLTTYQSGVVVAQSTVANLGWTVLGNVRDTVLAGAFKNEGERSVRIHQIRLFGNAPFALLSTHAGTVVEPGQSIDITIRYAPTQVGYHTAILDVDTETEVDPSLFVLAGATLQEQHEGLSAHQPISFGEVELQRSRDTVIANVVTNTSSTPVTIRTVDITGENAANFSVVPAWTQPLVLQPGESLSVKLRFEPNRRGIFTSELDLLVDNRAVIVPLSGSGGRYSDDGVVNFGIVPQGASRDTLLTFFHVYNTNLHLAAISDVDQPFEVVETIPALPATLWGYEPLHVRVRFRPANKHVSVSPIRIHWDLPGGERFVSQWKILRGGTDDVTSVGKPIEQEFLRLSPTPARDVIVVSSKGSSITGYELRDVRGTLVSAMQCAPTQHLSISTADAPAGMYTLRALLEDGTSIAVPAVIVR